MASGAYRSRDITLELRCSLCNLLLGFITTKHFGTPKIKCKFCYAKEITKE